MQRNCCIQLYVCIRQSLLHYKLPEIRFTLLSCPEVDQCLLIWETDAQRVLIKVATTVRYFCVILD